MHQEKIKEKRNLVLNKLMHLLSGMKVDAFLVDMTAQSTFEREIYPHHNVKDNHKKIIQTLDLFTLGNYDEIKVINVID